MYFTIVDRNYRSWREQVAAGEWVDITEISKDMGFAPQMAISRAAWNTVISPDQQGTMLNLDNVNTVAFFLSVLKATIGVTKPGATVSFSTFVAKPGLRKVPLTLTSAFGDFGEYILKVELTEELERHIKKVLD